jgi:hypothetical protein
MQADKDSLFDYAFGRRVCSLTVINFLRLGLGDSPLTKSLTALIFFSPSDGIFSLTSNLLI